MKVQRPNTYYPLGWKLSHLKEPDRMPLSNSVRWIPHKVSKRAIVVYLLALMACNLLYLNHPLNWYWCILGIIEVYGFFYFSTSLSQGWNNYQPRYFLKRLFEAALIIRVIYVFFSYWFYWYMTDTAFDMNAADVLFYDGIARYGADLIRNGAWSFNTFQHYGNMAFSDMGYPTYLSVVYFLTGNSILIARLIKAVLGAWTVVLIYKLATRNFGENTGRMAAIMCMLMPNLIYYCGLHLKEVEMIFLVVLFCERADYIIRKGNSALLPTAVLMLIPAALFTIRTALATVLVMAFLIALLFSTRKVIGWWKRILIIMIAMSFAGYIVFENTSIGGDIQTMWKTRGTKQKSNMEWRSTRRNEDGNTQSFAKYAGAVVFAPLIFTIPFPTMIDVPGQENQKMIHGGNFCKNVTSFFTILAVLFLLITGDWRKHVLPFAILGGYLIVLVFSNFAQSERFHLPALPFALMFAAYGMRYWSQLKVRYVYYSWLILLFVMALAWNWFKLAGRGMI